AVEPVAEAAVARARTLVDVTQRVGDGAHVAIADVLDERALVEQADDEGGVVVGEAPQGEPLGFESHADAGTRSGAVAATLNRVPSCTRKRLPRQSISLRNKPQNHAEASMRSATGAASARRPKPSGRTAR